MSGGPFAPAREVASVVCNDREGTLAITGEQIVFRPLVGDAVSLALADLVVVTRTLRGRHGVGIPAAGLALAVALALGATPELLVAAPVWVGVLASAIGARLYPSVDLELETLGGASWKVASQDSGLLVLARELRGRLPNPSRRTTAAEMWSDSGWTLLWPGKPFPWTRRAFAAWMLVSLPGPALLTVVALSGADQAAGGSGAMALLGGLGLVAALGQVALLPGLLLQLPAMWLVRRLGLVREV